MVWTVTSYIQKKNHALTLLTYYDDDFVQKVLRKIEFEQFLLLPLFSTGPGPL